MAGRYRLLEPLGSGGMGRVWKAHDERLDTHVAVKELWLHLGMPPEERAERLRRAEFEALSAVKLRDHPHVVTVHDVVVEDERPWIVMQLVDGGTLHERLAKGPLSVAAGRRLATALLDALDGAHQQGIVHRDVKPANVMVTKDRQILLTDFGIAASETGPSLTTTGAVIGSAPYLAPERAQGRKARSASDLFSLGVTLFEALEGVSPFQRDSAAASLHAVAYDDPPPMRRAGALEPLVTELLEKDPDTRASLARARELLPSKRAAGGKDTSSAPPGDSQQPPKKTRKQTSVHSPPPTAHLSAVVKVKNEGTVPLDVLISGRDLGEVRPDTTGVFKAEPGVRTVQVRGRGIKTDPWALRLKEGVTVRLRAWEDAKRPRLGHANGSASAPKAKPKPKPKPNPKPKPQAAKAAAPSGGSSGSGSSASTSSGNDNSAVGWGLAVAALILGLVLYAENASFSGWVSHYLNDPVSKAETGDCVYFDDWKEGEGENTEYTREWVEVPCWSGAAQYKVNSVVSAASRISSTPGSAPRSPCLGAREIPAGGVTLCATPA
ncbi:serine/threonine-protein kinase [Streptomyces sp. NPDC048172]|uniref:serine/threonine-protein kinase n=1 Tax=Streptomyces sp. NPDC048172 TaxID=3365505 RepID=UPI00371E119E